MIRNDVFKNDNVIAASFQGPRQDGVTNVTGTTDALPSFGTVQVNGTAIDNMTLAAPVAGTDDGKILTVISTGAYAHTITTPAGKINGTLRIATFAAAAYNRITFQACNGVWVVATSTGITLS